MIVLDASITIAWLLNEPGFPIDDFDDDREETNHHTGAFGKWT